MKRINFKKLTIQNFMSVGQEPVVVEFKEGMNIITGFNRDEDDIKNGVGKSVIIDAFYWAIFGESLRELKKEFIANRKNPKGCLVRLEFEDISSARGEEYFVIERMLGPSRLRVYKNDVDKTRSTIPETNKYIREVLQANEEIFQDCIIMRANSTIPFMNKKKVDKKNFIESIFNLSIFSDMAKVLKDDTREEKKKCDIQKSVLQVIDDNIVKYEASIVKLREEEATRQQRIEEQRIIHQGKITEETKNIEKYRRAESVLSSTVGSDEDLKLQRSTYEKNLNILASKRGEFEAEKRVAKSEYNRVSRIGDTCPTCNRKYDEETLNTNTEILTNLSAKIQTFENALGKINEKQTEIDSKLAEIRKSLREIEESKAKLQRVREMIIKSDGNIKMHENMIRELVATNENVNTTKPFEDMLAKALVEQEEKKGEVAVTEHKIAIANVTAFALGECGIRLFVVKKLLDLLNGRIDFYMRSFKSTFSFTFDEMFTEQLRDINGVECMYANCSGAEQKKIDLAIGFAFLDVLRIHSQVEYNVNFYDEILDSSLDNKSLENMINFIDEQTTQHNSCTYIITHKADISLPNVNEIVLLEKRNGFTTRNLD